MRNRVKRLLCLRWTVKLILRRSGIARVERGRPAGHDFSEPVLTRPA